MTKRYPDKLHHTVPSWVEPGSLFHIRIRRSPSSTCDLTAPQIGPTLLDSVRLYHDRQTWYARLFLLLPDHLHAILAFPHDKSMSAVMGAWKGYHKKNSGIDWQKGYFDHRLRNHAQVALKAQYIRMNPVEARLCADSGDWPWVIEPWKDDPAD